jgi:hypothetical protein
MKKYIMIALGVYFGMTSCTSFRYTEQSINDPDRVNRISNNVELSANKKFAVDVRVELEQIVTATSENHQNKADARNEAYYNCIVNNNIDLVVDPLYKLTEISAPGPFKFLYKNQYKYEIRGYAGFYENPTDASGQALQDAKDELALKQAQLEIDKIAFEREDALFKVRGKNLNALAKIDPTARDVKSSYMIETEEGCCPDNKNNVVVNGNSSGSGFGNVHLLHTAENKSSLVDEYLKLVCDDCDEGNEATPKKSTKVLSMGNNAQDSDKKGIVKRILCKTPILKKFFCK